MCLAAANPWQLVSLDIARGRRQAMWTLNCTKSDRETWIGRRFSLWLVWLLVVLVFTCLVMSGIDVPPGAKRQARAVQQRSEKKALVFLERRSPTSATAGDERIAAQGQEAVSSGAPESAVALASEDHVVCARAANPNVNGD
jgi:hypothetical protein